MTTFQRIVLAVALLAASTTAQARDVGSAHRAHHAKRHPAKAHQMAEKQGARSAVSTPATPDGSEKPATIDVAEVSNPVCIGPCAAPDRTRSVDQTQIAPSIATTATDGGREQIGAQKQISAAGVRHVLSVSNVTSTAEGRKTATQPVGGKDLCEVVGRENSEDCRAIPEAHPADFQHPQEQNVTPEAILIDNAGAGKGGGNAPSAIPASVISNVPAVPNGGISIITTPAPR